jgi:tetratricopeptide (TPR) repeat protein
LIRAWIGAVDDDGKEQIGAKLEEALHRQDGSETDPVALQSLLGLQVDDAGWIQSDPQERRRRLLRAIPISLLRSATDSPILMVLEDMHWADAESLAALDALVSGLAAAKLLMVASGRPEWRPSWDNRGDAALIQVGPLEESAAHDLISDLLGDSSELDTLRVRLVEETDAIPLFLEEMARMLLESGVVVRGLSTSYLTSYLTRRPDLVHVPDSVQALIAARIDRLPDDYREVLQVASVIGRTFTLVVLRDVAELPEEPVLAVLRNLQTMEFVYETYRGPGIEFCFKHALTQTAAYDCMLLRQRRNLHERVFYALKTRHMDRGSANTEKLALHAFRAELWSEALWYFHKAGREANEVSAHDAAIPHFENALTALEHLPASRENASVGIDVRLGLRVALAATADLRKIRDCLQDAERISLEMNDQERLALIRGSQCTILTLLGNLGDAVASGISSRAIALAIDDSRLRISAGFALGQAYSFSGELDKAIAVISADLTLILGEMRHVRFGTTGTPSVLCLVSLANSYSLSGELDRAFACASDALQIASETGRAYDLSFSKVAHGLALLTRGKAAEAVQVLEAALNHCRTGKLRILLPSVARFLGQAYIAIGCPDNACALLEEAVSATREKGILAFHAWCSAWLGFALLSAGHHEGAQRVADDTLAIARRCGLKPIEVQTLRLHGELRALRNEVRLAQECFKSAVALATTIGMRPEEAQARLALGHAQMRIGATDAAQRELATAGALFHDLGIVAYTHNTVAMVEHQSVVTSSGQSTP